MNLPKLKCPAILRKNKDELERQIQDARDYMNTLEPGTEKHKKAADEYERLYKLRLEEGKTAAQNFKTAAGIFLGIAAPVVVELLTGNTENPRLPKLLDWIGKGKNSVN